MSDSAIINDCLHHHINQHIQLRRDFFDLCTYDKSKFNQGLTKNGKKVKDEPNQECMAKIMRLIETLTDDERKEWHKKVRIAKEQGLKVPEEEPDEFLVQLSYGGICKLLYYTYGESVVRNSIAELLRRKYIKRVQETNNSIPCYVLNVKFVQSLLNKQAQEIFNSRVSKSTATNKENKGDDKEGVEIDSQGVEVDTHPSEIDSQALEIDTNNKYYNNPSDKPFNKDTFGASIDSAALAQLQEKNRYLEERLAETQSLLEEVKAMLPTKGSARPTTDGQNDTPLTPAGGNDQLPDAGEMITSDHTAISEPVVSPTMPLTESQARVALPDQDKPPVGEYSVSEMPSSTQAVKDLSNQATEQQQASGDDPIATGTIENPPVQPATKKARGGRGKSTAGKEEKPKKEITGSKEALAIVDMYISLFKHPIPLTQSMVDEAEKLVPCHPTSEDINGCRLWCYASNPDWYGKNGKTKGRVTMKDIVNNWAGWVASQEAPATGFQVPDELKDRVAGVYAALNEWRASKTGDAENVFVPDTESDQAICNLLQKGKRPTKKRMNAVCEAIWETPRNAKTGYLQREHMTVKMICLTYREREIDIVAKEQETQGPKNIVDLFDANRTFGNGLTYLPGALPVVAKSSVVMEG